MTARSLVASVVEALSRSVVPPVVTGHRLEIARRIALIQQREGVKPTTSSWKDGCRISEHRPQDKNIKGSKGRNSEK